MSTNSVNSFRSMLATPAAHQEQTLLNIVRKNAATLFGEKHAFRKIQDQVEYRRNVSLHRYDDLEPYIMPLMDGSEKTLFDEPVKAFFETSGTTSKPKYIPVSPSFISSKVQAMDVYWRLIYRNFPQLRTGKIAANFSAGASFSQSVAGHMICSETCYWNLMAKNLKRSERWPILYDLLKIEDFEARYYCIALFLLQDDIAVFMSPNPSTIYVLLKTIEEHAGSLVSDIKRGNISIDIGSDEIREKLFMQLAPNPARAAQLHELFKRESRDTFTAIWPSMKLYICWHGAMLKPFTDRIASRLRGIDSWAHLYQASESIVAIPDRPNQRSGILNLIGNFFEFIEYNGTGQTCPDTLLPHELEAGRSYEVVLTNSAGLYRYRIGDVVRVVDFADVTPRIEFVGRTGNVCSISGEKLTEQQVVSAYQNACSHYDTGASDYIFFPISERLPHYGIILAYEDFVPPIRMLNRFCRNFERHLLDLNVEYAAKRNSRRLGAVELIAVLDENVPASLRNLMPRMVTDQTKPTHLSKLFDLHRHLMSESSDKS